MSETLKTVDQILQLAKQEQQKYASGFWAPSLQKDVRFTEITTAQQKRLIKSVIDSPVFNSEFIYTLHDIFKENCIDEDVNIEDLTILDKLIISLGLRAACIGPEVDIEVTSEDGNKTFNHTINLIELYDKIKNKIKQTKSKTITQGVFRIECNIPTIKIEYDLERELRGKVENIEIQTNEELRNVLGDAFIGEVVKYIQGVSIKEGEDYTKVDWSDLSFEERIKVVDTFGMKMLKEIIKYINKIKEEVDKIEVINFEYSGEKFERRLTVDGRFFTIS